MERFGQHLRRYGGGMVIVAGAALFAFLSASGLISPHAAKLFSNHAMTILPAVAGVLSFIAAFRRHGRLRAGWFLLGCWGVLSATGNGIWEYYELVAQVEVPFPSLADAGYLSANLCAVVAIATFALHRKRVSTVRTLLDAGLIAGSVFLVSWELVLRPIYQGAVGASVLEQAVGLAYPVIDVVIVSLIVFVAANGSQRERWALFVVGAGFTGWAFSDSAFAYLTIIDQYRSGSPFDAGWIGGDALIMFAAAVSALRLSQREDADPLALPRWRTRLPYVASGVAFVVAAASQLWRQELDAIALPFVVVIMLLIVVRQFLHVVENQALVIEQLQSVDDMKNSILRAVSHELRTPLAFIKGAAEMLADGEVASADDQQDLFDRLVRNSERLEGFLSGLLDVERLSRGVLEPVRRMTDVTGIIVKMTEQQEADQHRVIAIPGPVWADVDAAQVERIVENLVVNAIRHTPAGTTVHAHAERVDDGVLISVEDNGPGVLPDMRDEIFKPFTQTKESQEAGRGTGVGLALVAKFAQLHGGRAWVEGSVRGGAAFRVLLADDARAVTEHLAHRTTPGLASAS